MILLPQIFQDSLKFYKTFKFDENLLSRMQGKILAKIVSSVNLSYRIEYAHMQKS